MLVEFHVCNFSFPKQVNHRLVCFQVCKHMKQLFLYQRYESYIGTLIISHDCKHMKWPFSYVWDFFFSKHMNLMLAKFTFANIWNSHFHMFEICWFSKHMSYMLGKFICFRNMWNGHFHMFEIFLFSKHMSYMLVKFICLQNIWNGHFHMSE